MAWTATEVSKFIAGPTLGIAIVTVTADNAYAAGPGETLDLSAIFPNAIHGGFPIENDAQAKYVMTYDRAALGDPVTGIVIASYGDWNAGADGALIEVAGAVNLSAACTGNWMFFGY